MDTVTFSDAILDDAARAMLDAPHLNPAFVDRVLQGLQRIDTELAGYRATVAAAEKALAKESERKR